MDEFDFSISKFAGLLQIHSSSFFLRNWASFRLYKHIFKPLQFTANFRTKHWIFGNFPLCYCDDSWLFGKILYSGIADFSRIFPLICFDTETESFILILYLQIIHWLTDLFRIRIGFLSVFGDETLQLLACSLSRILSFHYTVIWVNVYAIIFEHLRILIKLIFSNTSLMVFFIGVIYWRTHKNHKSTLTRGYCYFKTTFWGILDFELKVLLISDFSSPLVSEFNDFLYGSIESCYIKCV